MATDQSLSFLGISIVATDQNLSSCFCNVIVLVRASQADKITSSRNSRAEYMQGFTAKGL